MDGSATRGHGRIRALLSTSRGRVAVLVTAVVVMVTAAVVVIATGRAPTTSAAAGPEGTRTFEGVPDDLPADVVPAGATEVEGTVARRGEDWSAAVTFVHPGSRDDLGPHVDGVLRAEGYVMRQRAFDDETMQVIYDGPDGSVLTVTYQTIPEGTGTAVVLVSP